MAWRSSLASFIIKTIAFLVVAAACWYFIAPAYNQALTAVSAIFIPGEVALQPDNNLYIYSAAGALRGGIYIASLHYGLILVIVLVAATPRMKPVRRLQAAGVAVAGIFILNIASIVLFAWATLSGAGGPGAQNPLVVLFTIIGSDLFPVVIWACLSYRYFLAPQPKSPAKLKPAATQA